MCVTTRNPKEPFFNGAVGDTRSLGTETVGTQTVNWGTVGDWARLRQKNTGSSAPFAIRYWEFGNEVYGDWETSWTHDAAEYVNGKAGHDGYLAVRSKMRTLDSTILVGAVGYEDLTSYLQPDGRGWGAVVISLAGAAMDYYVIHPYAFNAAEFDQNDLRKWQIVLASPRTTWSSIRDTLYNAFTSMAGRTVPIAATEYNMFYNADGDHKTPWKTKRAPCCSSPKASARPW